MCGLFGFSGSQKPNIAKLKILGIYNESRGRDSCGYYFNGALVKGVDKDKLWKDFIINTVINEDEVVNNVFIGHTRQSSVGSINAENAHPFNINDKIILAHNGTISNIWDLCNKHQIPHTGIFVDSLALGHLIDKVGPRILDEYRGYAALLIHDLKEPGALWVYHGASKLKESDEKMTEERPLFFLRQKEGIYFSSLSEALKAINDDIKAEPEILNHNCMFKVKDGKFTKTRIHINRELNNVDLEKKTTTTTTHYPGNTKAITEGIRSHLPMKTMGGGKGGTNSAVGRNFKQDNKSGLYLPFEYVNDENAAVLTGDEKSLPIWRETLPPRAFNPLLTDEKDAVFFWKGRYWFGNNELCHGVMNLDKDGIIYNQKGDKVYEYYFYHGVMLTGKAAYDTIAASVIEQNTLGKSITERQKANFGHMISQFSKYPTTCLEVEGLDVTDYMRMSWWLKLSCAAGGITPVWTDRSYVFKAGNLVKIIPHNKRDVVLIPKNGTQFQNYDIFAKELTASTSEEKKSKQPRLIGSFSGGEMIKKINKGDIKNLEGEDYSIVVKSLAKFFDKKWLNKDEIIADCPSTVFRAVRYYILELLLDMNIGTPETELIDKHVVEFLDQAINDEVTFRENMIQNLPDPEAYLNQAYLDEISEGDDEEINDSGLVDTDKLKENKAKFLMELDERIEEFKKKEIPPQIQIPFKCQGLSAMNGKNSMIAVPFKQQAKIVDMTPKLTEDEQNNVIDEECFSEVSERIVTMLRFFDNKINSLHMLNNSPAAQDLYLHLIRHADAMKKSVAEVAKTYNKGQLLTAVNKINVFKN